MIKTSQKSYQLPLPEKITIVGSRVITSAQPHFLFNNNQLILSDSWVVQLVHTTPQNSTVPQLLEFPLAWEEVWPWDQEFPASVTIAYKKKPHIQQINTLSSNPSRPMLSLTLETPLEIALTEQRAKPAQEKPVSTKPIPEALAQPSSPPEIAILQQNYQLLEEKYLKLFQTITELEQRLLSLEEKQAEQQPKVAKLSGNVVDSFRLAPVAKAILEFYQSNSEEPLYKLATNGQGYFDIDDLLSGTYDIRVRHPRYLPLVLKSYVINTGEIKSQDFLLKRI